MHSLEASEELISDNSTNKYFESIESFALFKSDSDCLDFDGCSIDVCNFANRTCENEVVNDANCSSCNWASLDMTLDNCKDEASCNLSYLVNKNQVSVLSGK